MLTPIRSGSRWPGYLAIGFSLLLAVLGWLRVLRPHSPGLEEHRRFGEQFLFQKHPLYHRNACFNYMPVTAMFFAPLALVSPLMALRVRYLLALACLGLTLRLLWLMLPLQRRRRPLLLLGLTLVFVVRFILPDLDDAGTYLIYLAMLVGGWYCAWRGKDWAAGTVLGLVIAVKLSPGLLLPYFAWKRRWRLLGITSATTVAWVVLPAVWLGPASWWHYQQRWNQITLGSFTGHLPEQDRRLVEHNDMNVRNQSLKIALLHLLATCPEGHPLHREPGYGHFLNLNPSLARPLAALGLLALLAAFWRRTRQKWTGPNDASGPVELAGLLLMMLLLSPITWTQHLVWIVPAVFLLLAADWPGRWAYVAGSGLGSFLLLQVVQSDIAGPWAEFLLASHIYTVGLFILLSLAFWQIGLPGSTSVPAIQTTLLAEAA